MQQDIYNLKKTLEYFKRKTYLLQSPRTRKARTQIKKMPFSIRILLENALRNYDDFSVTKDHLELHPKLETKTKRERRRFQASPRFDAGFYRCSRGC